MSANPNRALFGKAKQPIKIHLFPPFRPHGDGTPNETLASDKVKSMASSFEVESMHALLPPTAHLAAMRDRRRSPEIICVYLYRRTAML